MSAPGSFWARRRAAVQAEADAELRAEERAQDEARAAALAEKDDAEVLAELGLPDPTEMTQGDDFSAFMARGVPEHLRRTALRSLWRSNPVLACVDGLNDYDDDYRAAAMVSEPIKTAYRVGKGMLRHIEEMERKADAALAAAEDGEGDAQASPVAQVQDAQAEPVSVQSYGDVEVARDDEDRVPATRRMRFRFEEARA